MKSTNSESSVAAGLKNFFFAEQSPYGLALVRMFLVGSAMLPMWKRFGRVRELYSSDGAPVQMAELFGQGSPLPVLPGAFASALFGVMLFSMLCSIAGFRTRLTLAVGTLLYVYFNLLDGVSTMTKYSVIAAHVMFILTLSNCGAVWSVDAILKRWKEGAAATAIPPRFPVWPARLIQLLFCFIYFGAAITKIQTQAFFSGEQMRYWMLSNWNYSNPVGEVLAMWTPVLLACGYFTVVWEITFAFLAWRPIGRYFALGVGIMFHVMTWLTLGLYIFPLVCISSYLSFLMEKDIVSIRRLVHRVRIPTSVLGFPRFAIARAIEMRPASVQTSILWVSLAALIAVGSAEADYRMDAYGMRSENGPLTLRPIASDKALAMIRSSKPVREKDKFFSFDIGSMLVGGQLANRSKEFESGDMILAQCNINPPHEDLWVECVVEDDHSRIIDSSGQFVTRDMLFANFNYDAGTKLVPGNYWMVLKSSGKEIARRPFTMTGEAISTPVADDLLTN